MTRDKTKRSNCGALHVLMSQSSCREDSFLSLCFFSLSLRWNESCPKTPHLNKTNEDIQRGEAVSTKNDEGDTTRLKRRITYDVADASNRAD